MKEEQIKHLEFIQGVITRMNQNSFQLKEWMITIMTAILALYASSNNVAYVFVAIIPVLIFWSLDAYYLQQERKFRGVYNDIVNNNTEIKTFDMPINNYVGGKYCYWRVVFSKTIMGLYFTVFLLLLMFGVILILKDYIHFCNCGC